MAIPIFSEPALSFGDTAIEITGSGNSFTGKTERVGRMVEMHADERIEIDSAQAGDIIAIVGMKNVQTGHTLCDPKCFNTERRILSNHFTNGDPHFLRTCFIFW
jgi:translation elongation factor EF-G